jgi:hypothetical protein
MTPLADVKRCTFEDVLKGELDADMRRIFDDYFASFAKPTDDGSCIKCGLVQGGLMAAIMGGFEYGLAHGEGRCSKCGWPGRANHYFKDKDGKELGSLRIILQYHPDLVAEPKSVSEDELERARR